MRSVLLLGCILLSSLSNALTLKADAPKQYKVKPGDTLWSIANHYLANPWEWKELWRANSDIKNPKRLYPGAIIVLDYSQEKPYLKVTSNGTIRLSPNVRPSPIAASVPLIPLGDIKPFLNESIILDEDVLNKGPYILGFMGQRMVGGQGDEVYVRGLHSSTTLPQGGTIAYSVFRQGKTYLDPFNNSILGYEAKLVGYGELVSGGEPAVMLLTNINEGIEKLDRVLINDSPEFDLNYEPSAPSSAVNGVILEIPNNMPAGDSQGAVGSVITISIGAISGLKAGDVLGVYNKERVIADPQNHLISIKLPQERIGEALVFRTFTKTSFALVVRSTRSVTLYDSVKNP